MHRVIMLCLGLFAASCADAQSFRDNFDKRALDLKMWNAAQIVPSQLSFPQPGRCGGGAVQITLKPTDPAGDCEACQRAEIRPQSLFQPKYGEEVWYGFSFKVQADASRASFGRNTIGQFRGPQDVIPFLAQRFDNGMFHITVEDQGVRRIIAKSEGDAALLVKANAIVGGFAASDVRAVNVLYNLQAVHRIARTTPDIASLLFTADAKSGLRMPSGKDWTKAAGEKMASLFGVEGEDAAQALRELVNVSDIERYVGPSDLVITPGANPILPDPREGWVDMTYRIRTGRTDNQVGAKTAGEIDVFANGRHVVSVKGNFGARLTAQPGDPTIQFKFGIQRDARAFEQKVTFDEFAMGASRNDVAVPCPKLAAN